MVFVAVFVVVTAAVVAPEEAVAAPVLFWPPGCLS